MSGAIPQELASIPFAKLLTEPLNAAVDASWNMALKTVDFVREIGFEKEGQQSGQLGGGMMALMSGIPGLPGASGNKNSVGKPIYVSFQYDKPGMGGMPMTNTITVPFLTMLPIPSLRIEEVYLEFNVKINSVDYSQTTDTKSNAEVSSSTRENTSSSKSWGWGWYGVSNGKSTSKETSSFCASYTHQSSTTQGSQIKREYTMQVKIKAVGDEMPAGLGRILDILEASIKDTPNKSGGNDLFDKMSAGGLFNKNNSTDDPFSLGSTAATGTGNAGTGSGTSSGGTGTATNNNTGSAQK